MNKPKRWQIRWRIAFLTGIAIALSILPGTSPSLAQTGSLFQDGPQATLAPPGMQPGMPPGMPPGLQNGGPAEGYGNAPPYAGLPFGGGPAYFMGPGGMAGGNYFLPPSLQSSFTYQPPVPARILRVNDIVSIRVEEIAQMIAQGNTTSRKTINFDAVLQDWIRMVGVDTIKPAPQSDGDPRVRFNENEVYRGDSTMRLAEQLTFNIAARVADIQPNGNVVLEARKSIEQSDNRFEASLSGICRAEDIG
ncbi:MAG: flagellar basal body L-ring protein FlgH, partial [Planctomycetota bacterium]